MSAIIDTILCYWFGELDEAGLCAGKRNTLWFASNPAIDRAIGERFGSLVARALAGELEEWAAQDRGLIALVLLLDQFTRNVHRDTPGAFAGDARALALAQGAVESGRYRRLPAIHQVFLYLPLEHCEDLDVQEECVTLFEGLAAITGSAEIADFARYATAHRDVIARFGRFPHRNVILGRDSTPEELEYLERHRGF